MKLTNIIPQKRIKFDDGKFITIQAITYKNSRYVMAYRVEEGAVRDCKCEKRSSFELECRLRNASHAVLYIYHSSKGSFEILKKYQKSNGQ